MTSIKAAHADGMRNAARSAHHKDQRILDVIMLAIGIGFFAVALAYVAGCERL
jgi:hypothetical protein